MTSPGVQGRLLDGYVRVSMTAGRSGPSFISPLVQRQQIEGWCELFGARIGTVFEEMDESGARADRPMLLQALERVEAGLSDGIVVARLDRFGRSLVDGLQQVERIRAAGGTFVSVQDGFDLSTDTGRLVLRLMLSMAEFELDRIRGNWNAARQRAVARGVHGAMIPPTGYRRGPSGVLVVDRKTAPYIRAMFVMRAEGAGPTEIGEFLRSNKVMSSRNVCQWTKPHVLRMLQNPVYLGEAFSGEFRNPKAHRALVDLPTWRAAQVGHHRSEIVSRRPKQPGLLTGLLRCATCRHVMHIHATYDANRCAIHRAYHCPHYSRGTKCTQAASISASRIELLVADLLFAVAKRPTPVDDVLQAVYAEAVTTSQLAEERLERFRDDESGRDILGEERYAQGLKHRVDIATAATVEVQFRDRQNRDLRHEQIKDVEQRWPDMTHEQKRVTLQRVYDCFFIRPGKYIDLEERVWICETGEAPPLPARARVRERPFKWPTAKRKVQRQHRRMLDAHRPSISERELEAQLRSYLSGRTTWPSFREFVGDGERRLWEQVKVRGGEPHWAAKIGVQFVNTTPKRRLWTVEIVREELTAYLKTKHHNRWPTIREFNQDGRERLRRVLPRFAPVEQWAQEMGVELSRMHGPTRHWTPERITEALQHLIGDSGQWPARRDFGEAGLDGCYGTLNKYPGVAHWAQVMGVAPPKIGAPTAAQRSSSGRPATESP